MQEIWKEIDDRYSISSYGRVKSNYANKERILKPFVDVRGYLKVDLRHGAKRKSVFVHRLVAFAFIPNLDPITFKEVNHKDEDKTNNHVENLEWCNTEYNCNYGTRNIRKAKNCMKKIYSLDADGTIAYYQSVKHAGNLLGISSTAISKVLSDKYPYNKTAAGRRWFYVE